MKDNIIYDLIIVGGGASGLIAAITAAREGSKVLILEKLDVLGSKLKATGGGRCNLTNTLQEKTFMSAFGREGRFMTSSLKALSNEKLMEFFNEIGVKTHAPDGFRVFPVTHEAITILSALEEQIRKLNITVLCSQRVEKVNLSGTNITSVSTSDNTYETSNVLIATGGLGYPELGAEGDGYEIAKSLGHKVTDLFPAMLPLDTKEEWVDKCKADTVGKVELRINLPKFKKYRAFGDLIFTDTGIRGPVVLDAAREITPLLKKHGEVPLLLKFIKGKNEEELKEHLKSELANNTLGSLLEHLGKLMPRPLVKQLCLTIGINANERFRQNSGDKREELIKLLVWTPLTIIGHEGFKSAMITRGGVPIKEINPETMESKLIHGLYFSGEVINLDGPCGGFNLQWAFSSGYLAGHLGKIALRDDT